MRLKIKSIFVVILLILSAFVFCCNFSLVATDNEIESEPEPVSTTRAGIGIDWSAIEVLSEPVDGKNYNGGSSTEVKIATEGNKIYVVWEDDSNMYGAPDGDNIFYRYFDGTQWSETEFISSPDSIPISGNARAPPASQNSRSPDLAVENGKIYVVWESDRDILGANTGYPWDFDIFFRCNLSGNGWEDIQLLSEPLMYGDVMNTNKSQDADITVENGNIYVVWADKANWTNEGPDYDIFMRVNKTSSLGWDPIEAISEIDTGCFPNGNDQSSYDPDIAVENGKIYVVWHDSTNCHNSNSADWDIFYRYYNGTGWDADTQVISEPEYDDNQNDENSYDPNIAVENGKIYVVWEDGTNYTGSEFDGDIFYRTNFSGNGWDMIQVISEPVEGQNQNDEFSSDPVIAVENGNVFVVWDDYTTLVNDAYDCDIFYRQNLTTSSGWADMKSLSEKTVQARPNGAGSNYDPYIAVVSGKCHVAWESTNTSFGSGLDFDIFYRTSIFAPELTGDVIPTTGNTSTMFKFTLTYLDIDNDSPVELYVNISGMHYPLVEANPGDKNYANGKNYYFEISYLDIGTHYYRFYAFDGIFGSLTDIVANPMVNNTIPKINITDVLTAHEDLLYEVDYDYEDIDIDNIGQIGHWSLDTDAGWLELNSTTGVLTGMPTNDDVGDYWVNITINDTMDIDFSYFDLEVINVNDPPEIIFPDNLTAVEDEFFDIEFDAMDIDTPDNELTWIIETNAFWLNVNNSIGRINGTPDNDEVSKDLWVNVSVDDGEFTYYVNYTLIVINTNDPPMIITTELDNAEVGSPYSFYLEAEDIDPVPQTHTWAMITDAGAWLELNSTSGQLHGIPGATDAGEFSVNITVNDGYNGTNTKMFDLKVELGIENLAPGITTTDVTYAVVNESYSVVYDATDDHTSLINLTWTWTSNAADWLDFNVTSRKLSGTPAEIDVGEYWVNISVSDESGLSAYHNFTITVSTIPPNNEPELSDSSMSPASGDSDTSFTFTVTYTDEDGDPGEVSVWIDGVEHKMTPDPTDTNYTDGVDYVLKTKLGEGEHDYYFTANDGTLDAVSGDGTTPTDPASAKSTAPISKAEAKVEKEDVGWLYGLMIVLVIIIIILVVLLAMMSRRGRPAGAGAPAEETAPPSEEESEEEWEDVDEDEEAADEEMDEEMEDEEDWDDEAEDEDEDLDEDETEEKTDEEMDDEEDWDEE